MTERAAHLVDHVFPDVPIRQWVLPLQYRVRYLLAWDHDVCRAVVAVSMRAILGLLRHLARDAGVDDGARSSSSSASAGAQSQTFTFTRWFLTGVLMRVGGSIPCPTSTPWMWPRCWRPVRGG